MKHHRMILVTSLVILATSVTTAFAGGWTQKKHAGLLITNVSAYRTRSLFDSVSQKKRFSDDGQFRKAEVNTYLEYGISDRTTFVGNFFAARVEFSNQYGRLSNAGLSDSEIGLKRRLNSDESGLAWSIQGLVKLPTSKVAGDIAIANHQTDVEARTGLSGNIGHSSSPAFWTIETAYRFRAGSPADEVRLDGTIGVPFGKFMVMGQTFLTKGVGNASSITIDGNPTIGPDFDLYKAQASLVYRVTRSVAFQAGYANHFAGRGTGAGSSINLGMWVKF